MRYRKPVKLCIQCGLARPLTRYTHDAKRCDYCITGAFRDAQAMRAALKYARTKALRAMQYTRECVKCHKARPASYFAWFPGEARKGDTCNSCLRRRKGRRPKGITPVAPVPVTPAEYAQRARMARILEREQTRMAEQERIKAQGKRCVDCWHVKPASEYRVVTRRRDGLSASCIACERAYRVLQPLGQWRLARDALRALAGKG